VTNRNGKPQLHKILVSWWREQREYAEFWPTFRCLAHVAWEFVRDSMPDRSRARFGDVDYDWEHRVDTTSANVSWRGRLIGLLNSSYQPIEPELFREMLNCLGIDYTRFTFIDIGSGKGRALLMACEYPFRKVIGMELLPELDRIAQDNIRKFPSEKRRCTALQALCGDATTFDFPSEPLVVFMFHPLPEAGFKRVIMNLRDWAREFSKECWLIYANPLFEKIVLESELFQKEAGTHQYSIFSIR
jgi:SAM-dependent methyltransferase